MPKNKIVRLSENGKEEIKKISRVAKEASTEGTFEHANFIEKHKKSLKKLAER